MQSHGLDCELSSMCSGSPPKVMAMAPVCHHFVLLRGLLSRIALWNVSSIFDSHIWKFFDHSTSLADGNIAEVTFALGSSVSMHLAFMQRLRRCEMCIKELSSPLWKVMSLSTEGRKCIFHYTGEGLRGTSFSHYITSRRCVYHIARFMGLPASSCP